MQYNSNCKKTKCIKLYCECFTNGEICGPTCNCTGCKNNIQNPTRNNAIESIMQRDPEAFNSKYKSEPSDNCEALALSHRKGCNCRKSYCQKKYCECFNAGITCSEYCKCEECQNLLNIDQKKYNKLNDSMEDDMRAMPEPSKKI